MSFLLPLIPSIVSAGAGLFGSYRENKLARRAERRAGRDGQFGVGPGEEKRFERFTPEQQNISRMLQNLLTGQGEQPGGLLGEQFGQEGFDAYAEPALRNYKEKVAPYLAETFSGLGAGAQRSSAFQNILAQSGENLSRNLGEFRAQQRMGSTQDLLRQVLEPQFHTRYEPRGPSGTSQALAGLGAQGFEGITQMLTKLLQDYAGRTKRQQGSYINPQGQITGPMY